MISTFHEVPSRKSHLLFLAKAIIVKTWVATLREKLKYITAKKFELCFRKSSILVIEKNRKLMIHNSCPKKKTFATAIDCRNVLRSWLKTKSIFPKFGFGRKTRSCLSTPTQLLLLTLRSCSHDIPGLVLMKILISVHFASW